MAIKHKTDIKEIFKVLAECSFLKITNLLSKQTIRKRNLSYKPSNHLYKLSTFVSSYKTFISSFQRIARSFYSLGCVPYQIRELVHSQVVGFLAQVEQFVVFLNLQDVLSENFKATTFLFRILITFIFEVSEKNYFKCGDNNKISLFMGSVFLLYCYYIKLILNSRLTAQKQKSP